MHIFDTIIDAKQHISDLEMEDELDVMTLDVEDNKLVWDDA